MKVFVQAEVVAEKDYTDSGYKDTFEFWWDQNRDKLIRPATPVFLMENLRKVAYESWRAAWDKRDETIEAVIVKPFIARG
jgi:hypothetical protein